MCVWLFYFIFAKNMRDMKNIQVVKVSTTIVQYFFEEMNMQNECEEYRQIKIKEFKESLQEALNCGVANKEIEWV